MGGIQPGSRERAFAKRLEQALDNHPRCPADYGRLTWVTRELAHQRINVTIETVRRWLGGMSMPRRAKMTALAKILQVDETWLAMGVQPVAADVPPSRVEELEAVLRQIEASTDDEKIKELIAKTRE
ncbi:MULTISPECIES: hypothetical protein [unclassified Sphingopyxis]|uniref:hypothetical protein n=1 Tax=unclassified Sphingopyxis TaxID=2614943 RepID=UPI00285D7B23|nr:MULTISPECIES: hypothetical protein [unclassified Sphingopyxis]MDR7061221.1 transcriptional regulator with XRE-family HTH domain [Sphingopyxis sp. BE235]MDR7182048.1 transcriptional regulator with XRE-family HTH domain [Sphingopyxis sp. BE249]